MAPKAVARRWLQRVGYDVTRHPAPNSFPWNLQQVLARRTIDGVVDVGAHVGQFARMMRDVVGYDGPIMSFEPSPRSFAGLLAAMSADPNWIGRNIALGAEPTSIELHEFGESDFNSFRAPTSYGRARFQTLTELLASTMVPVDRLDAAVDLPGQLLLKTDTQGFDLEVLHGATNLLPRVAAVAIELSAIPIYEGSPTMLTMMAHLGELGFELVGLTPLSRARDRLTVVEFDGVFARRAGSD